MRITGLKDHLFGTGYYYIQAMLLSVNPLIQHEIAFVVDTGAQITTISVKDSLPFYHLLPKPSASISTASGKISTSIIYGCGLMFDLVQSVHTEKLVQVQVLNPQILPQDVADMMRIPSLLGMDVLSRYYLSFDSNIVTLEK